MGMDLKEGLEDQLFADRYQLQRLVGKGGMGEVYLAKDTILGGEEVALKVLKDDFQSDERHIQRFIREVQLTRKVNHPNVIRTFDVGIWKNRLFLTMEYLEADPISDLIKTAPLDFEEACHLLIQICRGLDAIHKQDVIHRDLKLGNLLVTSSGDLKIADFGVARPFQSELTLHSEIVGSSHYMAPEVWAGSETSTACDIYALGVVAYELLTGCFPFDGNNPAELMWKHTQEKPVSPLELGIDIPEWLAELVLVLLEKDPQKRPCAALEIASYIQARLDGDTLQSIHDPLRQIEQQPAETTEEQEQDHLLGPLITNPPEETIEPDDESDSSEPAPEPVRRKTAHSGIDQDHLIKLRNQVSGDSMHKQTQSKFRILLGKLCFSLFAVAIIGYLTVGPLTHYSRAARARLFAESLGLEFMLVFVISVCCVALLISLPILLTFLLLGTKKRALSIWGSGLAFMMIVLPVALFMQSLIGSQESSFLQSYFDGSFRLALVSFEAVLQTFTAALLLSPALNGETMQTGSFLFWILVGCWSFFLGYGCKELYGNPFGKAGALIPIGTTLFILSLIGLESMVFGHFPELLVDSSWSWKPGKFDLSISAFALAIYFAHLCVILGVSLFFRKMALHSSKKSKRDLPEG